MKPHRVDLDGAATPQDVLERVVRTRLNEALNLSSGLESRDRQALHDFRIACKRLRYALERFESLDPSLQATAEQLAELQDALGEAHDRDVLLAILPLLMPNTEHRLVEEREAYVDRAIEIWRSLREAGAFG